MALTASAADVSASPSDASADAVLRVLRAAVLNAEQFDQDALATGLCHGDDNALIQFKWAAKSGNAVGPAELREICRALAKSTAHAATEGLAIGVHILTTNRPLTSSATALRTAAQRRHARRTRASGWHKAEWDVLKALRYHRVDGTHDWHRQLMRFGQSLACTPREIEAGIGRAVMEIWTSVSAGNVLPITAAWLSEQFVGSPTSPLRSASVRPKSLAEYQGFAARANLHSDVVRRELLRRIADAVATHRVVVVTGEGGDGKTVALSEYTRTRLEDTSRYATAYTAMLLAQDLMGEPLHVWLRRTLRVWSGAANEPLHWPPQMGLAEITQRVHGARLAVDEAAEQPVLIIACDGLDEASGAYEDASRLVHEITTLPANEPGIAPAVLVATSRDSDQVEVIVAPNPRGVASCRPSEVAEVKAGPFTPEELEEAGNLLSSGLGARLRLALERSLRVGTASTYGVPIAAGDTGLPPVDDPGHGSLTVVAPVAEALSHPAMWEAFCRLDTVAQASALQGEGAALDALAQIFMSWSFTKWKRRCAPQPWPKAAILTIITTVAQNHSPSGHGSLSLWNDAATRYGMGVTAFSIWSELQSSGVIRREGHDRWWWRHAFVGHYLAAPEALSRLSDIV